MQGLPRGEGDTRPLVFISHVHQDGDAALALQKWLDDRFDGGLRFFNTSDRHALQLGSKWLEGIESALSSATALLAMLTPAGLQSPWVNFETGAAWLRGALVVPCCVSPIRKSAVPPPYSHLQGIDLLDPLDVGRLVESLADILRRRAPAHDADAFVADLRAVIDTTRTSVPEGAVQSRGGIRFEFLDIEWRYRRSTLQEGSWAATYRYKARFEVVSHEKQRHAVDFNRTVDVVPFRRDYPPAVVATGTRSRIGEIRVGKPYRREGSSFAFALHFDPPLVKGETVELAVAIDFPAYKTAFKEELIEALIEAGDEVSDIDFNARTINDETERFLYRVVLPKSLGASPVPPVALYRSTSYPEETDYIRQTAGVFSVEERDVDGEPSWVMRVDRFRPPHQTTYRMRWRPPSRGHLA